MTKFAHKFNLSPFYVLFALTLSSCSTTDTQPAGTQLSGSICETRAALRNPNAKDSGIGGTGIRIAKNGDNGGEGGIGGTGIVVGANKPVFGTGGVGGTGIVGVITGFASICVNGVEVNYDTTTPVWENGQPSAIHRLAVGQVVSVTAIENGQQITARGIGVIDAVVGPISAFNPATGELRVLGQKINASQINLPPLKVGDWLRVSGHSLASGEVMASHVQVIQPQTAMKTQVRGIARNMQGKTVMVGDTRVDLTHVTPATTFTNGDELWISGQWNGQLLQAEVVTVSPTAQGLGRVEKIVLEGFIHGTSGRSLNLGSQTLVLSDSTQIVGGTSRELVINRRVQITGYLGTDQRVAVDRVILSRSSRRNNSGKSSNFQEDGVIKSSGSSSSSSGSGSSGSSGSGSSSSGSSGSSGSGSSSSGSSGSSGSGSSSSGSSGSSGKGSSGSGKSSGK